MAARWPDRVAALALLCTALAGYEPGPDLRAFEVQLAASPAAEPVRSAYDVATILAPTLLVSGAHDLPDFRAIAADLAARLPGARLIELDWAGHLPSFERPDLLNGILVDFLSAAPPGPS